MQEKLSKEIVIKLCDVGYPTTTYENGIYCSNSDFGHEPMFFNKCVIGRNENDIIYPNDVIDWFREEKKIYIMLEPSIKIEGNYLFTAKIFNINDGFLFEIIVGESYESTQIIGIEFVCDILNKKYGINKEI